MHGIIAGIWAQEEPKYSPGVLLGRTDGGLKLRGELHPDFQGRCTNLEGYTFDLGPRASDNFARTMKELERYMEFPKKVEEQ